NENGASFRLIMGRIRFDFRRAFDEKSGVSHIPFSRRTSFMPSLLCLGMRVIGNGESRILFSVRGESSSNGSKKGCIVTMVTMQPLYV
ncbi:hypothetical protein, partial [Porphyromonas loveana]|uniref:hypothetical protein n=1 Tax=Porphyromonas loveana TaxID=1884669 RepID=UPI0035A1B9BE